MTTENFDCDPSGRYLLCTNSFSDRLTRRIKSDVKKFMAEKDKDDKYHEFINWKKKENEILVLTMYAYAEIPLPKVYDTVFEIERPSNFAHQSVTILQAVINGWTGIDHLSRGHKHICVIQVDKTTDRLFKMLSDYDPKHPFKTNIRLGICDRQDYDQIKHVLENKPD